MSGRQRLLVGLTGGLAAGKSTAAALLSQAGCKVVDADRLVGELYRPGGEGADAVRSAFGEEMLSPDGSVDRRAMAERVFRDPKARKRLEALVHPLVRKRFEAIAGNAEGIVVLEAALLTEAGWRSAFDVLVTVEAPRQARLQRAVARGMHPEEAERRIAAQTEELDRRRHSDLTIENDGSPERLREQVERLYLVLKERLRQCAHASKRPETTGESFEGPR